MPKKPRKPKKTTVNKECKPRAKGVALPLGHFFPESYFEHYREVWRHQYRHGTGTFLTEAGDWLVCARDNGSVRTFVPGALLDFAPTESALQGVEECRQTGVACEVLLPTWWSPIAGRRGWALDHFREGWVITRDDFAAMKPPRAPAGFTVHPVTSLADAHKYKFVVDHACQASYGQAPSHLWGNLGQLIHPVVNAWIGRLNGDPVRTLALHRFHGVASMNMGSTLPQARGRHLGDCMLYEAIRLAFTDPSIQYIAGQTMPAAYRVAERLGAHPVLRFGMWRVP